MTPPGERIDRRTLVPGDPHALDGGQPLAGLVLALTGQTRLRPRQAWAELGVDIDDLTGDLISLGIHPQGRTVPSGATLTLPPRELLHVAWPPAPSRRPGCSSPRTSPSAQPPPTPSPRNDTGRTGPTLMVRLLCTSGTPSAVEVEAIAALAEAGWLLAVRADVDPAGLFHVRTMLAACPRATPWRMDAVAYRTATREPRPRLLDGRDRRRHPVGP